MDKAISLFFLSVCCWLVPPTGTQTAQQYQASLNAISGRCVSILQTSASNVQRVSNVGNTFDYYTGLTQQIHKSLVPLAAKIAYLANNTYRINTVNAIWTSNFKAVQRMLNGIQKQVTGLKVDCVLFPAAT